MCTRLALSATALRIRALETGALQLETHLAKLVQDCAPRLLQEFGVATIAAQILCSWSRVGRIRTETAFAAVAGVAPIPASSGQTTRYRLNRCGDRQLSRAIHLIVIARLAHHAETRRYAERRAAKGKTAREVAIVGHPGAMDPRFSPTAVDTTFMFVTDGVAAATEAAAAAASDKRVHVMGGASIVQQALRNGLVDHLRLHIVPLLLGPAPPCSTGRT